MLCPCRAVPWPEEVAFRSAWSGHGMGTAWARRDMCQLPFIVNIWVLLVGKANSQESCIFQVQFYIVSCLLNKTVAVRFYAQCFYIYVLETRPFTTS